MGIREMVRAAQLERLASVCRGAVERREVPGGVLLVGRQGETLVELAFGRRAVLPQEETATPDTIYDWASLTKPVVTATLFMQAVEEGRVHLHEPLGRGLCIPSDNALSETTARQLLLHISGLPAGHPLPEGGRTRAEYLASMVATGLSAPPETQFVYSDLGFHLLAALVEDVFAESLDTLAEERILKPLRMVDTRYGVKTGDLPRAAPTEEVGGVMLCGTVHDPVARAFGGVAGHAGLFGTAHGLARYCRMVIGRGQFEGSRILQPGTVDRMLEPVAVPGGRLRALGWDVDSQYSSPRGDILPVRGAGHTGFTGPSFWIDPPTGIYIILMTNRVHPDGSGDAVGLRRRVANVVASALLP